MPLVLLVASAAAWFLWPNPPAPVFGPASLDFEPQLRGTAGEPRAVNLENQGERALEILAFDGLNEHFQIYDEDCVGRPLMAGEGCIVQLVFAPTVAGELEAELVLVGNAEGRLRVAGRSTAPRLSFGTESVEFGGRPVGAGSSGAAVVLKNEGTAPLTLGRITIEGEDDSEFSLIGRCRKKVLEVGEACDLRVAFAPQAAGSRVAALLVQNDGSEEPGELPLRGEGVWEGPEIASEPPRLVFGVQKLRERSQLRELALTNRSEESVWLSAVEIEDEDAGFSIAGEDCVARSLAPAEGCKIRVSFTPRVEGLASTVLLARREAGGGASARLLGEGATPAVRVDPEELEFEAVRAGFEGAARTVRVISAGRVPLVVDSVGLAGVEDGAAFRIVEDGCSGETLAPGRGCEVAVIFRPRSQGVADRELILRSDATDGPRQMKLQGRGVAPRLELEPERVDFGGVVRSQSSTRKLVLANRGDASLSIKGLRLEGTAASDYRLDEIGCRLDEGLSPGEQCTLRIGFVPSVDGLRTATIRIEHGSVGQTIEAPLQGRGLPPKPRLRVEPARVEFGSVAIGERSSIVTVTLRNEGDGSLSLRGFEIEGIDGTDFLMVPSTCGGIPRVAPHAECTLGLRFVPSIPGTREAILRIRHDDPEHEGRLFLAGTGTGGSP